MIILSRAHLLRADYTRAMEEEISSCPRPPTNKEFISLFDMDQVSSVPMHKDVIKLAKLTSKLNSFPV
jgi:hypothetical protein